MGWHLGSGVNKCKINKSFQCKGAKPQNTITLDSPQIPKLGTTITVVRLKYRQREGAVGMKVSKWMTVDDTRRPPGGEHGKAIVASMAGSAREDRARISPR
mmetsp:Transcript_32349/g.77322  ORF Transcript_32349/g.77322 Transcript_32349/m.77322 type:complete len:101 (+) Transcript_32349:764-1066(+)